FYEWAEGSVNEPKARPAFLHEPLMSNAGKPPLSRGYPPIWTVF
ncbi:MAG: hypothetical protein ACI9HK_004869, partial [Pirellulaceae bacterium]